MRGALELPPTVLGTSEGLVGKEYVTSTFKQEAFLDTSNSHDFNLLCSEIAKTRPLLFLPSAPQPAGPVDLGTVSTGSVPSRVPVPTPTVRGIMPF